MALTTFTSGQVLTAAQLNAVQANDYNQTVSTKTASYTLVAADKGTRVVMNVASANTVTVNTSLFSAGDTLVIQNIGAGTTTVTAGTATVSSAGPLAIPQNGSGTLYFTSAGVSIFYPSAGPAATSGLTLITSGSLSGSSTTFSSAFSATYDNYKIMVGDINNAGQKSLTLGSATTGYESSSMYVQSGGAWTGIGAVTNKFLLKDASGTRRGNITIEIMSPFLSATTSFLSFGTGEDTARYMCIGIQNSSTSFTAFTFATDSGTMTGNVKIYGYQNS